jgi:hypothetical protein
VVVVVVVVVVEVESVGFNNKYLNTTLTTVFYWGKLNVAWLHASQATKTKYATSMHPSTL